MAQKFDHCSSSSGVERGWILYSWFGFGDSDDDVVDDMGVVLR